MWWGRSPSFFWGGLLVALGVLFLLANAGVLNNINWDLVWPILLIVLGGWLLVTRIGPVGGGAGADSSAPLEGLTDAKVAIAVGSARIDVRSASLADQLYHVHVDGGAWSPDVRFDRGTGTLHISERQGWFPWGSRVRIDAQLSDQVRWAIDCSTGAVRGSFQLSTARLGGFDCKTGTCRIDLALPAPTGTVPIHFDGGSVHLNLTRPPGAAIGVKASGASVHLTGDGTRQDGLGSREWRSAGFDSASDRFDVAVSGGAVHIEVNQR
jgi:hypothetical protein